MSKNIYDLKLNETLLLDDEGNWLRRVPGGWIYYTNDVEEKEAVTCVFVPYNNDFDKIRSVRRRQ